MFIKSFRIQNFKLFQDTTFYFNSDVNILTGINNSGKTTVLEALSLWEACFSKVLRKADIPIRNINIEKGDYMLGYVKNYGQKKPAETFVYAHELISLRSVSVDDILYNKDLKNNIQLSATFENETEEIAISFEIKINVVKQIAITFLEATEFDYSTFKRFFGNQSKPINVVYASPISGIQSFEEFKTQPQIQQKINAKESVLMIRNRLNRLATHQDISIWQNFENDLAFLLNNNTKKLKFQFHSNIREDVFLNITLTEGDNGIPQDISLFGSGTLQIIETLLAIYTGKVENNVKLNLILLDEPDSHIHPDIQKRLLFLFLNHYTHTQVFLTTHNTYFIASAEPKKIFWLQGNKINYYPIQKQVFSQTEHPKKGLQLTPQLKLARDLGHNTLDFWVALSVQSLIFVEGNDDAFYLQTILNKKYSLQKFDVMFWSCDGINNLYLRAMFYKDLLSEIKNSKTLWEKTVFVFDKDFLTLQERERLMNKMQNGRLTVKSYIWNCYTIEGTILTEWEKFIALLEFYVQKNANLAISLQHNFEVTLAKWKSKLLQKVNEGKTIEELETRRKDTKFHIEGSKSQIAAEKEIFVDKSIFPPYNDYLRAEIEKGNIYCYMNKDEVYAFIREILPDEIAFEKEHYFLALINLTGYNIWFKEWDNMIETVESIIQI